MPWAPDYTTTDDLAAYMRITDHVDDAQLARAVTASSRTIDRHCRRQFGLVAAPEPRIYTPRWSRTRGWLVPIDDLMTTVGLIVEVDTAGDGTYATPLPAGYVLSQRNAQQKGKPWTDLLITRSAAVCPRGIEGEFRVTGRFGWTAVPGTVVTASLLQGSRLAVRRDAPFGVAGSPDAGSEMRLLAKVDPDVAVLLTDFQRRVGIG